MRDSAENGTTLSWVAPRPSHDNGTWGPRGQSLAPDTLVWHFRQARVIWLPRGHSLASSYSLLWLFRSVNIIPIFSRVQGNEKTCASHLADLEWRPRSPCTWVSALSFLRSVLRSSSIWWYSEILKHLSFAETRLCMGSVIYTCPKRANERAVYL